MKTEHVEALAFVAGDLSGAVATAVTVKIVAGAVALKALAPVVAIIAGAAIGMAVGVGIQSLVSHCLKEHPWREDEITDVLKQRAKVRLLELAMTGVTSGTEIEQLARLSGL